MSMANKREYVGRMFFVKVERKVLVLLVYPFSVRVYSDILCVLAFCGKWIGGISFDRHIL